MATHKSPTMHDRIYAGGAHGNLSVHVTKLKVKTADGDVIEALEIPAGLNLLALRVASTGLGAGVKATVQLDDVDLVADIDVSSDKAERIELKPVLTERKHTLKVTLEGGNGSGTLFVTPEYIAKGTI